MTGLGDRLREARTAKGYTLDDLQSITKIQKRYLSGIENEDFSMMPGSFYVRAFIKQYAEAVEIDPDEMLSLYRDNTPEVSPGDDRQITSSPLNRRSLSKRSNKISEVMPKIIVALFIILIVVVVWQFYKFTVSNKPEIDNKPNDPISVIGKPDTEKGDGATGTDDGEDDTNKEEPEPDPEPEVVTQVLTAESIEGETTTYSLTGADTFMLEIQLTGPSWIGVVDSDRKERTTGAGILNAGDSVQLDVSDTNTVRIRVGRPKSTQIYVNGELLEYASEPQDTVGQNIVIEYKSEQ